MSVAQVAKQVRFYEVAASDREGNPLHIAPGFWAALRDRLKQCVPSERVHGYQGVKFAGEVRLPSSPAVEYIKFGRIRTRSDWPDTIDESTVSFGALSLPDDVPLALAESTYIVDLPGENVIATLTTSRALNASALESWLSSVLGNVEREQTLQVLPLLSQRTADVLERASGISKFRVRLPKNVDVAQLSSDGDVGAALAAATRATFGEMEVDVTWSLNRSHGTEAVRVSMLRAVRSLVGGVTPIKVARASLFVEGDDGEPKTEEVDFIKQRVAYRVRLDVNQDESFSEEQALRGIGRAIDRYRDEMV